MNAINKILEGVNEALAQVDQQVLEAHKLWAKERREAIIQFKKGDEAKQLAKDQWAYYDKLFAIAGGKAWYNIFDGRNLQMIEEVMEKHCKKVAEKRNASIAKKLEKAGVTEVLGSEWAHSNDGYNGTYRVNTNNGEKIVTIETILAGGYNIQCLHNRVLTKVK